MGFSTKRKAGVGPLVAEAFLTADGRVRQRLTRVVIDPGTIGTGIQVTFSIDGTTVGRFSVPVAQGTQEFCPVGVHHQGGDFDDDIDIAVATTAGTENWRVDGEWTTV